MGRSIGIDLGTTNTAVAVLERGRPKVIADDKGYKVLPSVISLKDDGSFVVGQAARNFVLTRPDRTVYAVKRLIGRRFDSEQVQAAARHVPYEIGAAPDGTCQVKVGDAWMTPVEVSAIVLKVARQIAAKAIGEEVDEAVITVPAYFTHAQRAATMEAARLAGLRCERLLNEPTAAALAYGHRKDVEKNILIYDLGGGTFDVSVLHLSHGVYEVLATSGDSYLGGEDFDSRIVDWLAEGFLGRSRVDLRKDPTARQRLREAAERAKCELSFQDKANILIPRITSRDNLEEVLTRPQLEDLVRDLVDRTVEITRDAVNMAMLRLQEIDDVVLVGGQTRMPRVREAIGGLFGKEPNRSVHPEEVVAIGAAVHAQALEEPDTRRALLIDVTPFDLGIDAAGGFFSTLIERNSRVPITRTRTFTTARDNQDRVRITVRQGGSQQAVANEFLGEFNLTGIAPAPRMEPKLDVTFRIDANGLLHVAATDRATGERQQILVRNYAEAATNPQMPDEEQMRADAARRAAARAEEDSLAPVDTEKPSGMKRLAGLFKRTKKPAAATPAAAGGPEDAEVEALAPEDVEVEAAELEAAELEAAEVEPLAPMLPTISLVAPPLADDETLEAEEDFEDALVEPLDEPAAGPAVIGTALRSDPFGRGQRIEEERGVQLRAGPSAGEELSVDDGELAAAFLEQLESGSFEGFDDDLFDDLGDDGSAMSDASDEPALGLLMDDTVSRDPARSYRQRGEDFEVARPPAPVEDDGALAEAEALLGELDPFADEPAGPGPDDDLLGAFDEALASFSEPGRPPRADAPPPLLEEDLFGSNEPAPRGRGRDKKPATLRISYGSGFTFAREYRENLANNRTFIKTPKPLSEGRTCHFELRVSGVSELIELTGVVTWSSRKRSLPPGEEPGMRVEFQLTPQQRRKLEQVLDRLGG